MVFENDVASFSDCDSQKTATRILQAVYRRDPQLYSVTTTADSGNCWNLTSAVRGYESGSKTMTLFIYPRYSVQSQIF